MCKSQAEGGRRCPSSAHYVSTPEQRARDRERKQVTRAVRRLDATLTAVTELEARLAPLTAALNAANEKRQAADTVQENRWYASMEAGTKEPPATELEAAQAEVDAAVAAFKPHRTDIDKAYGQLQAAANRLSDVRVPPPSTERHVIDPADRSRSPRQITQQVACVTPHFEQPIPTDDPELVAAAKRVKDADAGLLRVDRRYLRFSSRDYPQGEGTRDYATAVKEQHAARRAYNETCERLARGMKGQLGDAKPSLAAENAAFRWAKNRPQSDYALADGTPITKHNLPTSTHRRAMNAAIEAMRECDRRGLGFDVDNGDKDSEGQRLINQAIDDVYSRAAKRAGWQSLTA